MTDHTEVKTLEIVTFGGCGADDLPLFRVNAGVPLVQALEQAPNLLYCAKHLAPDAAMEPEAKRQAWASHYLCEMSKAIVDDISQRFLTPDP
ncbi:hypothetical protein AWM79_01155 [Pseudomonas agarici]|uniref:DUF3077 domain-containing protein n=1 Tax=Pseudomonas agarici TaxID=46677 RepID=A0A0X8F549_PSEAA|nr:DUF3077 domain-containing protein [Pseudomonas agarici]AMB83989.1 hypothetical protein AWM79_01155 [Pseudomonas agarici]